MSKTRMMYPDGKIHNIDIKECFLVPTGEIFMLYKDYNDPNPESVYGTTVLLTKNGIVKNPFHRKDSFYFENKVCDFPIEYMSRKISVLLNEKIIYDLFPTDYSVSSKVFSEVSSFMRSLYNKIPKEVLTSCELVDIANITRALFDISHQCSVQQYETVISKMQNYITYHDINRWNIGMVMDELKEMISPLLADTKFIYAALACQAGPIPGDDDKHDYFSYEDEEDFSKPVLRVYRYLDGVICIDQVVYDLIKDSYKLESRFFNLATVEYLENFYEIEWVYLNNDYNVNLGELKEVPPLEIKSPNTFVSTQQIPLVSPIKSVTPVSQIDPIKTKDNNVVTKNREKHYIVIDSRSNPEKGNGTYNIASLLMGTCELIYYAETDDSVELVSGEKYNKQIVDYLVETHRKLRTNCSNSCKVPIDSVPPFKIGDIEYEFVGSYKFQEMYPERNVIIEKTPEDNDTKETLVEGFMGRRNMIVDGYKNFEDNTINNGTMKLTKTNN